MSDSGRLQTTMKQLGKGMEKLEFRTSRKKLGKTQKQLAELLGMSLKTIHSYEQGWRSIPNHIERQIYFLLIHQRNRNKSLTPCWEKKHCEIKEDCPAWEFQSGHLCWFLCGTLCECTQDADRKDKLKICRECDIFTKLLD
jgi:DNA-binding XRE family transcriptional regulator